ncbi:MAG: sugar phosphate isomerase/epimerase [Tepidisphaeraceae bacterium]|jgi:sugar phosphate isomerase/epimerase
MLRLSAFADEISPNLDEQIRVCRECGVTHFELRGVYGKNVMDFDDALRREIKRKLADNGLGVISIGSPIGKVKINESWDAHFDRFKKAVELAEYFAAPLIRIFSYYPPEPGQDVRKNRDEVMRRMRAKVEYIRSRPVTLVHENEKDIYGDKGVHCLDLMKTVNDPKLRCAFDFANFVQVGEDPAVNWPLLKPYTVHIHIKDAVMGTGNVVLTGKGDGKIEPILVDAYKSGYRGFLTLEPHLRVAGHSHGETGPDLFKVAADTLRELLRRNGIELAKA